MNKTDTGFVYDTPIGKLTICCRDNSVIAVLYGEKTGPWKNCRTALSDRTAEQLQEYFGGKRRVFDLSLNPQGTAFQQAVWAELRRIPYGETRSYRQIAAAVGHPAACRAVGAANHRNPIPILIPCHRVLGTDGSLTGYAAGLDIKKKLLELEGIFLSATPG